MRRHSRGQGLIEFAVILPVFAFLVAAVIDGGLLMGRYNSLNSAAREGARLGAISGSPADDYAAIVQRVKDGAMGELGNAVSGCGSLYDNSPTVICVDWISGPVVGTKSQEPGQLGSLVRVRAKYRYTPITPLVNWIASFDASACATARLERPVSLADIPSSNVDASAHGCADGAPPPVTTSTPVVPTATSVPATATAVPPTPTKTPKPKATPTEQND